VGITLLGTVEIVRLAAEKTPPVQSKPASSAPKAPEAIADKLEPEDARAALIRMLERDGRV
jgi:hypothetical protein